MVGTPSTLVLALLAEFAGDLRAARTINQLARSSGKAYANTHATAQMLLQERILLKEVVGHSHQCRLNLANDKTLLYLSLLEVHKRDRLVSTKPEARVTLARIDEYGPRLGILLAWYTARNSTHSPVLTPDRTDATSKPATELLLITTHAFDATQTTTANELFGVPCTPLPLAAFLQDTRLRTSISREATLLVGHALYASLLREVPR